MIASRVVDVYCLPIPQEHLTAQGIAVWNESKQMTTVEIQHKTPLSLTPMLFYEKKVNCPSRLWACC